MGQRCRTPPRRILARCGILGTHCAPPSRWPCRPWQPCATPRSARAAPGRPADQRGGGGRRRRSPARRHRGRSSLRRSGSGTRRHRQDARCMLSPWPAPGVSSPGPSRFDRTCRRRSHTPGGDEPIWPGWPFTWPSSEAETSGSPGSQDRPACPVLRRARAVRPRP